MNATAKAPPRERRPRPQFRVLYADDHRDLADTCGLLLQVAGFKVKVCYNGLDALREALEFQPVVCFLDLNMPGAAGDEVGKRLRSTSRLRPRLVAVTARADEDARRRIEAAGFDLHLVKPVDPGQLVSVVEALCKLSAVTS